MRLREVIKREIDKARQSIAGLSADISIVGRLDGVLATRMSEHLFRIEEAANALAREALSAQQSGDSAQMPSP